MLMNTPQSRLTYLPLLSWQASADQNSMKRCVLARFPAKKWGAALSY